MRTRLWLQAALELLLGLYLLETLITGEISFYIAERFNWLAVLAGVILLVMGSVSVITLLTEAPADPQLAPRTVTLNANLMGHTHQPARWLMLVVLAIPLALGILVPARPLGASAIGQSGVTTSLTVAAGDTNTFSIAPEQRNVLDWVRAFSATTNPEEFSGQPADLIGFVYRDARFDEASEFMVARFTVSCCTADAIALGVIVNTENALKWTQDTWIRVRGRFQTRQFDGKVTPVLVADSIEPTAMPDRPYLFP
jgi:uncharacterized repeat protein (TIGR03943 family)